MIFNVGNRFIDEINNDDSIDGIMVELPIIGNFDRDKILNRIDYRKDVDGLTEKNFASLAYGKHSITPCTPKGIMEMLKHMNTPLDGKDVVIIGRSHLVGLPLLHLLLQENATVTICHSHTENLKDKNITLFYQEDLIDKIWDNRPSISKEKAYDLDVKYAGKSRSEKFNEIKEHLTKENKDRSIFRKNIITDFYIKRSRIKFKIINVIIYKI